MCRSERPPLVVHDKTVVEERLPSHVQTVRLKQGSLAVQMKVAEGSDIGDDAGRHTSAPKVLHRKR
jgi:hypothetical protein